MDFHKLGPANRLTNYVDIFWLKQPFRWNQQSLVWEFHAKNVHSYVVPSVFVKILLIAANMAALYLGLNHPELCSEINFIGYFFQILFFLALVFADVVGCTIGKDLAGLVNWAYSKKLWLQTHGEEML